LGYLGLYNKPKAEVHPGHTLTEEEEEEEEKGKKKKKRKRKRGHISFLCLYLYVRLRLYNSLFTFIDTSYLMAVLHVLATNYHP
jgi:hypothetical protein